MQTRACRRLLKPDWGRNSYRKRHLPLTGTMTTTSGTRPTGRNPEAVNEKYEAHASQSAAPG